MADEDANPVDPRTPLLADLVQICRELNSLGTEYMVVGGFAVIQHGHLRTTGAVDLLINDSPDNQAKAKKALEILPDKAVLELGEDDLRDWVVVRVCDEVVVDLMTRACGISYEDGKSEVEIHTVHDVQIPFASPRLLLQTKQTYRDKDTEDRAFLEGKIAGRKQ